MLSTDKIINIAEQLGTPLYIFDKAALKKRVIDIQHILGEDVCLCYAMKANPFLVDAFKTLNTKYEVCSPGEFSICERESVNMKDIVLSGVNKEQHDIAYVMDKCGGVGVYTVESIEQHKLLAECASERKISIDVLLRVTSGNQFGLDEKDLKDIISKREQYPYVNIIGIQCYTGTQKKKFEIIKNEIEWLDGLCDSLLEEYGFKVKELEYGPGLPVAYFGDDAYNNNFDMLQELADLLKIYKDKYSITLEMGRYLAAECGVYVTEVADIKVNKGQKYIIADGGINHINYYGQAMAMKIPAYSYVKYDKTVIKDRNVSSKLTGSDEEKWTVCGSLCTVADLIVKNLPIGNPDKKDKIIFYNIGAYSVTEGIYLFLSRKMPVIAAFNEDESVEVYRNFMESDRINSRQMLLS